MKDTDLLNLNLVAALTKIHAWAEKDGEDRWCEHQEEVQFLAEGALILAEGGLPELTDEEVEAMNAIPKDAVQHWMMGEKWDGEKWIPKRGTTIVCPDCGKVEVRPDVFNAPDEGVSGLCPKCGERLYFGK